METTLTFAQLLRHAIDNRLLDVHTALIGRIEKYDADTQLADIKPVLKQAIKPADGIKEHELPILIDVPLLFPRAGAFFVSLPIEVGDYVQVLINESSIEAFLTGSTASIDSLSRFSLQGAVAIPGVYPQAEALKSVHKGNLVIGHDDGVQIHIEKEKILLGSERAKEALAIASRVEAELKKIINTFNNHTHAGACPTGSVTTVATLAQLGPAGDIASKKVVAE